MIKKGMDILTMELDTLKDYLKVDFDEDDTLIEICWHSAVSHIETLIQCNFENMSTTGEKIPYEVTMASLLLTTTFYEQRNMTYIPKSVKTSVETLIRPHYRYGSHWDKMVIQKNTTVETAENPLTGSHVEDSKDTQIEKTPRKRVPMEELEGAEHTEVEEFLKNIDPFKEG